MIKENQKILNRIQVLLDGITTIISYALAWYIRFRSGIFQLDEWYLSFYEYMRLLLFIVPGFLILYYVFRLYVSRRVLGRRQEAWRILQANAIGVMCVIVGLYLLKENNISRTMLGVFAVVNVAAEVFLRNVVRYILRRVRRTGHNLNHMVLVGYSRSAEQYIDRILANPEWGYRVTGILDDDMPLGAEYKEVKVIGSIGDLEAILAQNKLDEIAITLGLNEYGKLERVVNICEKSGIHTKIIPDYYNLIPTRPYTEDVQGLPVVNIRKVPLSNTFNRVLKRTIDIIGSVVAIILFSPVMLVTVIAVKTTSPGPLLFKQERIGYKNKPFYMYKFRSMVVQKEEEEEKEWTTKNDPRVTSVGKVIRRLNIDELPQLFNILRGDMSLVGPRPERPQFVEKFKEEIPRYMVKHQVRPGLTGWAQVNGYRGDTSIRKRIEYDLYYIENWTLGFDIKIILLTFFKGFKNAY
jgi:Undecaprenyl-phosphate glucose phosphotransferase